MPRSLRTSVGGVAYHVLNRANARASLFDSDDDYQAFECVLVQRQSVVENGSSLIMTCRRKPAVVRGG